MHTHANTHTDNVDKNNFEKKVAMSWPLTGVPGLKIKFNHSYYVKRSGAVDHLMIMSEYW